MNEEQLIKELRKYLKKYVRDMLFVDLSVRNLRRLFQSIETERDAYPLYFLWILPEYSDTYNKKENYRYIALGINMLGHMRDLFQYNSFITDTLHKIAKRAVVNGKFSKTDFDYGEQLRIGKTALGEKSYHMLVGCQKFIWSFISSLERQKLGLTY
jgi:hypothetical protein